MSLCGPNSALMWALFRVRCVSRDCSPPGGFKSTRIESPRADLQEGLGPNSVLTLALIRVRCVSRDCSPPGRFKSFMISYVPYGWGFKSART